MFKNTKLTSSVFGKILSSTKLKVLYIVKQEILRWVTFLLGWMPENLLNLIKLCSVSINLQLFDFLFYCKKYINMQFYSNIISLFFSMISCKNWANELQFWQVGISWSEVKLKLKWTYISVKVRVIKNVKFKFLYLYKFLVFDILSIIFFFS